MSLISYHVQTSTIDTDFRTPNGKLQKKKKKREEKTQICWVVLTDHSMDLLLFLITLFF